MNLNSTKKRLLSTSALLGLIFAPSALAESDLIAAGVGGATVIEQRESYALKLMTQIYDGVQDFSHTQMLGFGRVRKGNRSLTQFDFGDGAVVLDRPEGLAASRFVNVTPVEMAVVYNYDTKKIAGDSSIAAFHNRYVHPWLGKGPALGADATWETEIPIAEFGIVGASGPKVEITLSRDYFRHDGKDMVLVHYAVPSFRYDLNGRQIIQWGRGISLTDPSFSMIYLNSTLHRSVVMSNGGPGRPLRYARTMVAANPDGSAMVDYRDVKQLAPYIDEFFSAEAMRVVPTAEAITQPDDRPITLAKNIDIIALSIGEDGANDVPITAGAQASPNRGQEVMTMQDMQALAQQQAMAQQDANALGQIVQQTQLDTRKTQLEMQKIQSDTNTKVTEMDFESQSSSGSGATRGGGQQANITQFSSSEIAAEDTNGARAEGGSNETGARAMTGGQEPLMDIGEIELEVEEAVDNAMGGSSGQDVFDLPSDEFNRDRSEVGVTQFGQSEIAAEDTNGARAEGGSNETGARAMTGGQEPFMDIGDIELEVEEAVDIQLGGSGGQDVFDLPSDEFNNTGGGFEISPETMEEIERSRAQGGDPAQQAFDRVRGGGGDEVAFGGQGDPNEPQGGIVQQTGSLYAGSAGASVGALVDKAIALYGRPDKFLAAASAISDLQQLQKDLQAEFDALEFAANNVAYKSRTVTSKLASVSQEIKTLQQSIELNPFEDIDNLEKTLERLEILKKESDVLTAEMKFIDQQAGVLGQISKQLPGLQSKLDNLAKSIPNSKLADGFTKINQFVEKTKAGPVLSFLGGVGNISSVYGTATSLGTFDPSDADLQLSGDYSSTGAIVRDVTLDMLGILSNAASGNVVATFADVSTFATVRFVDLYKVVSAAEQTKREVLGTELNTELGRMKARNNLQERITEARLAGDEEQVDFLLKAYSKIATPEEARKFWESLPPMKSPIYTDEPTSDGGVSDPNWQNPNYDPNTGYPVPAYWSHLKTSAQGRAILTQLGIDPEAPVGGWPGGVGPEHRPKSDPTTPKKPSIDGDGPSYPTAPPSTQRTKTNTDDEPEVPAATVLSEAQLREIEREKRKADAQAALDEYQKKKLADLKRAEEEAANEPKSYELRTSTLETSELLISKFDIEPVKFKPVTFEPVKFDKDGDLFDEDGNLKKVGPDDFKMTPFDPPDISKFPPTDPDDVDGYPGTGEYPSVKLDSISGSATEPDLDQWADWLATQDIRKLDQMARSAGYPSLAFALADAENIIRRAMDSGYRAYANRGPNCAGYTGCTGSVGPWKLAYATIRLGDILADSRDVFSTGGLSDVGISGFNLQYALRDFGIQDGDLIDVEISQFGRPIFTLRSHFLLTAGTPFNANLRPGVSQMVITALNEGSASPNTAEVSLANVARGDAIQTYSLNTGQTAVLRIEAGVSE